MARIIDSDAINKRLFDEISDLDNRSRRIRGENFRESTAAFHSLEHDNYANADAVDNANFNGIEMSKIKQLVNYLQTHKKEFKFDRILDRVDNEPKETSLSQYGTWNNKSGDTSTVEQAGLKDNLGKDIPNTKTEIVVPDGFDGRDSFVYPRLTLSYLSGALNWQKSYGLVSNPSWWEEALLITQTGMNTFGMMIYDAVSSKSDKEKSALAKDCYEVVKRSVEQNESFHFGLAMQGDVNNVNCWSAPIEGTTASWLMVAKQKNKITITTKANLAAYNAGYDADSTTSIENVTCKDVEENQHIVAAYVDALVVYWRDK